MATLSVAALQSLEASHLKHQQIFLWGGLVHPRLGLIPSLWRDECNNDWPERIHGPLNRTD